MKKISLALLLFAGVISVIAASATSGSRPVSHLVPVNVEITAKVERPAAIRQMVRRALFSAPAAPNISYASPQTYTPGVAITPLSPTNTGGAVPARAYGQVATVAGDGTTNIFDHPTGVAVATIRHNDDDGNRYDVYTIIVTDNGHNQIKTITSQNGAYTVGVMAGSGTAGYHDGYPDVAQFNNPVAVSVDKSDQPEAIYIADRGNNRLRIIYGYDNVYGFTGMVSSDLYAATNVRGVFYKGDGFYFATEGNEIDNIRGDGGRPDSWGDKTAAGMVNGDEWYNVRFNKPAGLAFENHLQHVFGNLFVADAGNNSIRKIVLEDSYQNGNGSGGFVTTFAGNGTAGFADGMGENARFNNPTGVVADQLGNLYVTDAGNNMIRKITPDGAATTFAGTGAAGWANGNAPAATFNNPQGITIDDTGMLYITDTDNNLIRSVSTTGYTISPALPAGLIFDSATGAISGTPLAPVSATNYTVTAYNSGGSSSTTITITVTGTPPPNISYASGSYSFTRGTAITPQVPINTGSAVPANVYSKVTTLSGSTTAGSLNGPKSTATFNGPSGVAIDSAGSIYVADYGNYMVRRITFSGMVGTFAGTGSAGAGNYVRTNASFNSPAGLAVDTGGNLYVADPNNYKIRKINTLGGASTAAGRGIPGELNGIPGNSSFNLPYAVAVDKDGNILIADTYNNAIRKLVPGVGVTTLNTGVTFSHPEGIISDISGNIFVSDFGSNKIYKITWNGSAYTATIFAGSGTASTIDGTGAAASFSGPRGMAFDHFGNLYVSDYNSSLIRKITAAGVVTTLAGMVGTPGSVNGIGKSASFWNPAGMTTDKDDNLYIADYSNNMIRKMPLTGYIITPALPLGLIFYGTTGTIAGTPKQTLAATNYNITAYNSSGSSTTTISIEVRPPGSMLMANTLQEMPIATGEPNVKKVLSPNADGINDVLTVENIGQYPNNKMTILSAAGTKVYEASGYGSDGKLFDGHSNAGKMQAAGTYFYVLEYGSEDGAKRKTGYFVIKE